MGCNCKVNEKILRIHKKYGHRTNVKNSEKLFFHLKEKLKLFLLLPILIIFVPIIIIWIISSIVKGENNINISNFLNYFFKKKSS